ncbi:hypothetical protein [Gordonia alkanivorans]|uniref:hypothetical protein n=1 Tax=Gordonia alkanivorans TaxID=84096 RepID=UPI001F4E0021|nr:hypothetical protein [Gordonia alkanivorans]
MNAEFDQGVDAMIRSASQHLAQQTDALRARHREATAAAAEYFRQVVPMGVEAFAVLARRGLTVHAADPTGRDSRARYIRLSQSGTIDNPDAWSGRQRFLSDLRFLHANGLLIHRHTLHYHAGETEQYRRDGGIGEPPVQPPRGVPRRSDGSCTWYDDAGLRQEFVRSYRALSSGPIGDLVAPEKRPATDNDGFLHVDVDSGTTYVVWRYLDGGASKGVVGEYLADDLRVETLHSYMTRVVVHEAQLQERRVRG